MKRKEITIKDDLGDKKKVVKEINFIKLIDKTVVNGEIVSTLSL